MQCIPKSGTIFLCATALLTSFFLFNKVNADIGPNTTGCGSGKHMSTSDDVAKGLPANTCVDDSISSYLNGGCGSNPYDMLQSGGFIGGGQVRPVSSGSSGSADPALRQGIDPALACRLFKFFEATKAKGCTVKIISAYRSAQQQEDMCGTGRSGCAAAGRSCHQYGLAVDVQTSCIGWMRAAAPQFQLVFPYYGQHIQCAEHPVAACSTNTKPCNGGVKITPDLSRIPNPSQIPDSYFVPPPAATNPFSSSNSFMPNAPVPPPPYSPQSSGSNTSSYPTNTSTNSSGMNDMNGTANTIPLPTATSSIFTVPPPYPYSLGTSSNPSSGPSAYQKLELIARDPDASSSSQSTPTSVSAPTQLNGDLNDIQSGSTDGTNSSLNTVEANTTGGTNETNPAGGTIAKNSVSVNPIHVTETFSGSQPTMVQPSQAATSGLNAAASKSLILALLTTLRDLLVSYLHFLQSRSTYGFQGSWQVPAASATYR